MICNDPACGCAITSETITITGSGTPADPWVIEQVEFADLVALETAVDNLQAVVNGLPSTYVAKAGDDMSGPLIIFMNEALKLQASVDNTWVGFYDVNGNRIGYVGSFPSATPDEMRLTSDTGVAVVIYTDGATERVRVLPSNGIVVVGKSASAIASNGVELGPTGAVWSTRSTNGLNFRSNKTGSADINGGIHFDVLSAGTTIGSITRATASTTAYNTSSDEDLKSSIEPLDAELARYWMRTVQPMLFEYILTPGDKHVGYIAQRIAAAWPESVALGIVTPGHGDVNLRTWDADGNETTPREVWRGWEIDLSKFTPFVHAALRDVDVRVVMLEDIVAEHSALLARIVEIPVIAAALR